MKLEQYIFNSFIIHEEYLNLPYDNIFEYLWGERSINKYLWVNTFNKGKFFAFFYGDQKVNYDIWEVFFKRFNNVTLFKEMGKLEFYISNDYFKKIGSVLPTRISPYDSVIIGDVIFITIKADEFFNECQTEFKDVEKYFKQYYRDYVYKHGKLPHLTKEHELLDFVWYMLKNCLVSFTSPIAEVIEEKYGN